MTRKKIEIQETETEETLEPYDSDSITQNIEGVLSAQDFAINLVGESAQQSAFAEYFIQNFIFYNKSLDEWSLDLQVELPKNASPQDLQKASILLANNLQVAAHFKAIATSIYNALVSGLKLQKDDLTNGLVRNFLRANVSRPAAKVLDSMVESHMKDGALSRESAKLAKDFWTQKYDALVEVRKCIEQINLSIITEQKYTIGETTED
jgi:hypothetical protein